MKKMPEWPGVATAVGLIVVLTIVIAGTEPKFQLKEWQPLMAAIIALGGGALAYVGAMAKVKQDRVFAEGVENRRRLGLCLQLQLSAENLAEVTNEMMRDFEGHNSFNVTVAEPPEILKAWDNLDALPNEAIRPLNMIRWSFSRIQRTIREVGIATERRVLEIRAKQVRDAAEVMNESANALRKELQTEIDRLRNL